MLVIRTQQYFRKCKIIQTIVSTFLITFSDFIFVDPSDTASTLSQSCSQSHASVPVAMATAAGAAAAAAVAAPSQISAADSQCK